MKYVTSICYHCDADATAKERVPFKNHTFEKGGNGAVFSPA
jgi:hypothetical protein